MAAPPGAMEVDTPQINSDSEVDMDTIPVVKMVVLDGVVMGPQVNDFEILYNFCS